MIKDFVSDTPYRGETATAIPGPVGSAMQTLSITHDLLDRLNGLINIAIGEAAPMPAMSLGKSGPAYDGNLGDLGRGASSVRERIEATHQRLDQLQHALSLNT